MWPEIRDALKVERDVIGGIRRIDAPRGELRVRIAKPEGMARALGIVKRLARPVASISGVGSNDIEVRAEGDTLVITLSEAEKQATDERTLQQSLEIIRGASGQDGEARIHAGGGAHERPGLKPPARHARPALGG